MYFKDATYVSGSRIKLTNGKRKEPGIANQIMLFHDERAGSVGKRSQRKEPNRKVYTEPRSTKTKIE